MRPAQLNREKSNFSNSYFPLMVVEKIEGCEHFSEED